MYYDLEKGFFCAGLFVKTLHCDHINKTYLTSRKTWEYTSKLDKPNHQNHSHCMKNFPSLSASLPLLSAFLFLLMKVWPAPINMHYLYLCSGSHQDMRFIRSETSSYFPNPTRVQNSAWHIMVAQHTFDKSMAFEAIFQEFISLTYSQIIHNSSVTSNSTLIPPIHNN